MKKMCFVIWKNVFFLLLFYGCSFGFPFQKWFVKLEKVFNYNLNHSKWKIIEEDLPKWSVMGCSTLDDLVLKSRV